MENGNLIRHLREMAEEGNLTYKQSVPILFEALAMLLERQALLEKEVRDNKVLVGKNPMYALGEIMEKQGKRLAIVTVVTGVITHSLLHLADLNTILEALEKLL